MKIGFFSNNYPEIRCIINRTDNNYVKIGYGSDPFFLVKRILTKLKLKKGNWDDISMIKPILKKNVDIIHSFNTVCKTSKKWVVTFESIVPRTNEVIQRSTWEKDDIHVFQEITNREIEALCSDNCLALIALSQSTAQLQLDFLNHLNIDNYRKEKLTKKITVIHPPQEVFVDERFIKEKYSHFDNKIKFIFVGRDFFRKGGAELLDTLLELKHKFNFELTIISSLNYGDYASKTEKMDQTKYLNIIKKEDWITYYESLPNNDVIELCKQAHIGVLPTLADTYGYSVLEMQACGLPVITTNIRALPEINDSSCGWICDIPLTNLKEAKYSNRDELENTKWILKKELVKSISDIFHCIDDLEMISYQALSRIKKEHSLTDYAEKLNNIFLRNLTS